VFPGLTEAALAGIIEAVFAGTAAAFAGPAKDLGQRVAPVRRLANALGRDPRRVAFGIALTRTYATFARAYPEWTAALFDQTFLAGRAAPLLARCIVRGERPTGRELASLWCDELGIARQRRRGWIERIEPASANFLRWFHAELRSRDEFGQLFDSLALDRLVDSSALSGRKLDDLTLEVKEVLAVAHSYLDAVRQHQLKRDPYRPQSIWQQRFFSGRYASMSEYYIPPDEVFDRVDVDRFTGRGWLDQDFDSYLEEPSTDRGIWLLVGEAGSGKTSFLAHLVRERGYVHLFCEQAAGDANLPRALQSLAVQLISRFRIEPYASRDSIPAALSTAPDFLARILYSASDRLGRDEKLILVVDGLDEAGVLPDGNVLGLPRHLPRGVFLVLSQRPVSVGWHFDGPVHRVDFDPLSPANQQDVVAYLNDLAADPRIHTELRQSGRSVESFVRTLADKSAGNWMYLHYVTEDIRGGRRRPNDLDSLPSGLAAYYAQYWSSWRDRPDWATQIGPLLATLGACQEAVPQDRLSAWSGTQMDEFAIRRLLLEQWRPFVTEIRDNPPRYRLYHASLRDFLSGTSEKLECVPGVVTLVDELRQRVAFAHGRIVDVERTRVRGDLAELARDEYLSRHLATHLRLAGDADSLFSLTDDARWGAALMSLEPSGSLLLNDLRQASMAAETLDRQQLATGHSTSYTLRSVRSWLGTASLRSMTRRIPSRLLAALIQEGLWSPAQAIEAANLQVDARSRIHALSALVPVLPQTAATEALRQALALVPSVRPSRRGRHDEDDETPEWQSAASIHEGQGETLKQLVDICPSSLMPMAFDIALSLASEDDRAEGICAVAGGLPKELIGEALGAARMLGFDWKRQQCLAALAPHCTGPDLETAVEIAAGIEDEFAKAQALGDLAPFLAPSLRLRALAVADVIVDDLPWVWSHLTLGAPSRPRPADRDVFSAAVARVPRVNSGRGWLAHPVKRVAPNLTSTQRRSLLASLYQIGNVNVREPAVLALLPHLSRRDRAIVVPDLLSWISLVSDELLGNDESHQSFEVTRLAPHLSDHEAGQALRLALALTDVHARSRAVQGLVPIVSEADFTGLLDQASDWADEDLIESMARRASPRQASRLLDLAPAPSPAGEFLGKRAFASVCIRIPDSDLHRALGLAVQGGVLPGELVSRLGAPLIGDALGAVNAVAHPNLRAAWLASLGPYLAGDLVMQAWECARSVPSGEARARVLTVLCKQLDPARRREYLPEALSATEAIHTPQRRALAMLSLAEQLEPFERRQTLLDALSIARSIGDDRSLLNAEILLAPGLSAERRASIEESLRRLPNLAVRSAGLARLSLLPGADRVSMWQEAISTASAIEVHEERAEALAKLAPYAIPGAAAQLLQRAVEAALLVRQAGKLSPPRVFQWMAEWLPESCAREAAALAGSLPQGADRAMAVVALLPYLPPALAAETADIALSAGCPSWARQRLLTALLTTEIPFADNHRLDTILAELRSVADLQDRASALVKAALHLPPPLKEEVLDEVVHAALAAPPHDSEVLRELSGQLTPDLARIALQCVRSFPYAYEAAEAASMLADDASAVVLDLIHDYAGRFRAAEYREEVLEAVATRQAELGLRAESLEIASNLTNHARRAHILLRLATTPGSSNESVQLAFESILALPDKTPLDLGPGRSGSWMGNTAWKASALAQLSEVVEDEALPRLMYVYVQCMNGRPELTAGLVKRLAGLDRVELQELWVSTLGEFALGERAPLARVLIDALPIVQRLTDMNPDAALFDEIELARSRWN
jgi:hypothetical protein